MPFIDCPLKHGLVHEHINAAQRCRGPCHQRFTSGTPFWMCRLCLWGCCEDCYDKSNESAHAHSSFIAGGAATYVSKKNREFLAKSQARRAKEQDREYRASQKRAARKARLDALKPPVKMISARLHRGYVPYIRYITEGSKMPRAEIYKQMKMKGLDPRALDDPDMMVPAPEEDDDDLGPMPTYPEGTKTISAIAHPEYKIFLKAKEGCNKSQLDTMRQQMIKKGLNPRALRDPLMPVPAPEGMDDDAIEELMASVQPEKDPEVEAAEAAYAAQMKAEMLAAWAHYFDDQGYLYYYNSKTGETSWDPPVGWKGETAESWAAKQAAEGIAQAQEAQRARAPSLAVPGALQRAQEGAAARQGQGESVWDAAAGSAIAAATAPAAGGGAGTRAERSVLRGAAGQIVGSMKEYYDYVPKAEERPKTPEGVKSLDPTKKGGSKGKKNFGAKNSEWSIW
jgi:hypothetical protein